MKCGVNSMKIVENLLKVKSIVTLTLLICLAKLILFPNPIDANVFELFKVITISVVSYYFGKQDSPKKEE